MTRRSTYTAGDRPQIARRLGQPLAAPEVEWSAELVQPTEWVDRASQQPLVVRVKGPVRLRDQRVQLGVRKRGGDTPDKFADAAWETPQGDHEASAVTTLGGGVLALAPGRYAVIARIGQVVLRAGTIAIR